MQNKISNKTILITRDQKQSTELVAQIEQLGGKCIVFPTVKITAPDDWSDCDDALNRLDSFDWIIFSSINGVRFFLRRIREKNIGQFRGKVAAVGAKTKKTIEEYGWQVDLIPEEFSAEGILRLFDTVDLKNKSILMPISNISRDELPRGLKARGAMVRKVVTYKTECAKHESSDNILHAFMEDKIDAILFFSPSAVKCFIKNVNAAVISKIIDSEIPIGAVGRTTAHAIQKAGLMVQIMPEQSTQENLINAVLAYFNTKMEIVDAKS